MPYNTNFLSSFQIKFCSTYFLAAHPHFELQVHSAVRFSMLRRHLGVPIYHDSSMRLICSICQSRMDHLGDPLSIRKPVLGVAHQPNKVCNVFAIKVFGLARLSAQLKAMLLIPATKL